MPDTTAPLPAHCGYKVHHCSGVDGMVGNLAWEVARLLSDLRRLKPRAGLCDWVDEAEAPASCLPFWLSDWRAALVESSDSQFFHAGPQCECRRPVALTGLPAHPLRPITPPPKGTDRRIHRSFSAAQQERMDGWASFAFTHRSSLSGLPSAIPPLGAWPGVLGFWALQTFAQRWNPAAGMASGG